MSEIFRKVLTEDRLPDKKGIYHTSLGDAYFETNHKCFFREGKAFMPISWMEMIDLPTDEETENIKESSLDYSGGEFYAAGMDEGFDIGFNSALKYINDKA